MTKLSASSNVRINSETLMEAPETPQLSNPVVWRMFSPLVLAGRERVRNSSESRSIGRLPKSFMLEDEMQFQATLARGFFVRREGGRVRGAYEERGGEVD